MVAARNVRHGQYINMHGDINVDMHVDADVDEDIDADIGR